MTDDLQHIRTLSYVDEQAGRASARCCFTVLQKPPRLPSAIVVGGAYHDRFARVDGAWRFAEKAIHVDCLNDVSHHFRISDGRRSAGRTS